MHLIISSRKSDFSKLGVLGVLAVKQTIFLDMQTGSGCGGGIMSPSKLSDLILTLPHVEETTPFGPEHFVHKVGGKIFAIHSPMEDPLRLNLKCDPERAMLLREEHESIIPGYHMNKRHWNTLILDGSLPAALVKELIRHSYELVFASLPRKVRETLI